MERQNVNPGAGEGYPDNERGKNAAVTSMVLGIVAVVLWFFSFAAVVSVVLGIIGLVYANKAKTEGFRGGFYTAGFVLSLIGLIGGAIVVIVSIIAIGLISSAVTAAGGLGLSMMDICAENLTFCC
jgi:hypothetical protein